MSTVSQRIPNLLSGISQQPDNRKRPGQVKDATNVFPDYTLGMLKRPGGKFVSSLVGANGAANTLWFPILRDSQEKYIVQYADNRFKVWSLLDGSVRVVDMGSNTGVPSGCNTAAMNTLRTNAGLLRDDIEQTATKLGQLQAAEKTLAQATANSVDSTEKFYEITYSYDNLGNVTSAVRNGITQSGIDSQYQVIENGVVTSTGSALPAGYAKGTERTDELPLIAMNQLKVWEGQKTVSATNTPPLLGSTTAYNTEKGLYDTEVSQDTAALANYTSASAVCDISTIDANAYLKDATPADIRTLTVNDYTFIINTKKTVELKTATSPTRDPEALVVVNIASHNTTFTVTLTANGVATTYTRAATTSGSISPSSIADDLKGQINGNDGYTAVAVGPTIHITRTSDAHLITVSTSGGIQDASIQGFSGSVGSIADLPTQCVDGYVIKVVNTVDYDIDDMYVKFETDGTATTGFGAWRETIKPGLTFEFNELTMPHVLIRQANGHFTYGPPTKLVNGTPTSLWDKRIVGDDSTNPIPSFVGSTLDNMFFYRNRIGVLSGGNIVLSRAGDLFNFFNTSAQTATDDDPIDLSAAGTRPAFLRHSLQTSVGMVIYGDNEQYLLTTDSEIFSPSSARVKSLSTYECNSKIEPVSLGTSHAFISSTPLYSKVFELFEINTEQPPLLGDATSMVPELIPASVDNITASSDLSLLSIGTKGSPDLYQFRFLARTREDRQAQSWYKWKLIGNLVDQFFDGGTYYALTTDGTNVNIETFDVSQSNEQGFLTLDSGEKTDVCLDLFTTNPHRTYDDVADKTTIMLPYKHIAGKTFTVVVLGGLIGDPVALTSSSVGNVLQPTVTVAGSGDSVEIDGDFRGKNLIIGYTFDMNIDLPKFFKYEQADGDIRYDDNAELIIHRLLVQTGLSGPIDYVVTIKGVLPLTKTISSASTTINVTTPQEYLLNSVNISASATHNVPVYQRNNNLAISIQASSPFPVSLLGLDWEGKYNNRFYRRV